ncbi:MAG: hypothetical protein ACXVPQ_08190 [Bacteroidia bacterium]
MKSGLLILLSFLFLGCYAQTPTPSQQAIKPVKVETKTEDQKAKEAAAADKRAKQKAGLAASQAEDEAAIKADAEKRKEKEAKQKEGLKKAQEEELAEEKAIAEKKQAKQLEKQKAADEKAAKQKEGLAQSEAEDRAAEKAAADKREAQRLEQEQKEKEAKHEQAMEDMKDAQPKHTIPATIGSEQKYKETLARAEEYYKMKRYKEAKTAYEDVLRLRADDAYAKGRLAEVEKLISN